MLPHSIESIRKSSELKKECLIAEYLCSTDSASTIAGTSSANTKRRIPEYLKEKDLIESHLKRTEVELYGPTTGSKERIFTRAFTRTAALGYRFDLDTAKGRLCEISIAALSTPLKVRADLHVPASFFSTMVASADDYLDKEGSYEVYGEKLFYVSHAYRDLMDLALEEELNSGAITEEELKEIRVRLGLVLATLIKSENTTDANDYLYRKSCGDSVVSVLFPASLADRETREMCAEIGRNTGEAGQLIDDVLDYEYDLKNSKKNFIIMRNIGIEDALDKTERRIDTARRISRGLIRSEPVSWVLESLTGVVDLLRSRHQQGLPITPATLKLSRHVSELFERKLPAEQFLAWF